MTARLAPDLEALLAKLARSLVDGEKSAILVRPNRDAEGFWFGAGSVVEEPGRGRIAMTGRFLYPGTRPGVIRHRRTSPAARASTAVRTTNHSESERNR